MNILHRVLMVHMSRARGERHSWFIQAHPNYHEGYRWIPRPNYLVHDLETPKPKAK